MDEVVGKVINIPLYITVPRKKGAIVRIAFITLSILSLVLAWCLSDVTSKVFLLPLPNHELDHLRLERSLKSYLDSIDLLIEPSSTICSDNKTVPILVLVTSSPNRFEQRKAIRRTWAKYLPTYFILGLDGTLETMKADNYLEAKLHSDVIIYNFREHYQNLTLKTALILKWTSTKCYPKMLFKTDDDVLVNPWMMKRVLKESKGKDLVGYKKMNSYLHRDEYNKWYLPRWLYRRDFIEEYLSGTGYLINGNHIKKILDAAYKVPMINLEDVYFTYLVAKHKLGLKLFHDHRLSPYKPWLSSKCLYAGLALGHSLRPKEIIHAWSFVDGLGENNECEPFLSRFWSEWLLF